jgi:hypothetical protein
MYARIFATAGVGFALSERQHLVLLLVAVSGSLATNGYRAWRSGRALPLVVGIAGCVLIAGGHFAGDGVWFERGGMLMLLIGEFVEYRASRHARFNRALRRAVPTPADSSKALV